MARIESRIASPGLGPSGAVTGSGSSGLLAYWTGATTLSSTTGVGYASNTLTVAPTNVGGNNTVAASNTDNTNGASNAILQSVVGGTSGGDPALFLTITGGTSYYMANDNSDSDTLKIGHSSTIGSNVLWQMDSNGLARYFGTGLAVGAVNATTNNIIATRRDQNGLTRVKCENGDVGASAIAAFTATGADDFHFESLSTAGGALGGVRASASLTGGIRITTVSTAPVELRTNNTSRLYVDANTGGIGLGVTSGLDAIVLRIRGAQTGTAQYAAVVDTTFNSGATVEAHCYSAAMNVANSAFTLPILTGYRSVMNSKGASATVTRVAHFFGEPTTSGTNNVVLTDSVSFAAGNWFIKQEGVIASRFGGQVRMASLGVANSAAGSTLGTVVKKVEVFSEAGVSLGYAALYDAIT